MTDPKPGASQPIVGPERSLPEITIKALLLGVVLAMLMAAANAYLGLRVGMTVAASIPASAIALGVLRYFRRSNILESNQVQTIASAGASTVSGIIFTVPALVMMGAWTEYSYWPMFLMVMIGGVMGVVFTTPMRRALIVNAGLTFPEGVATAEVLKTGGVERDRETVTENKAGAAGFRLLLEAAVIGAVFKLCEGVLKLFVESVAATKGLFSGAWLFKTNAYLLPSLLGIGFIVGPNIGTLMLSGAVIGTVIAVPLNWLVNQQDLMVAAGVPAGTLVDALTADQWTAIGNASFKDCRRIGIGCMLVGGVWSLISLYKPMRDGVKASLAAFQNRRAGGAGLPRTELDTPLPFLLVTAAVMTVPLFFTFRHALEGYEGATGIALIATSLMLLFGFLFCGVAGYMTGLVGSSNNPVSGVTMATVVVSSLLLVQLMGNGGIAGRIGPAVVIYLAAFICTGACIAGDNLQDLKCGHLVGSTPWKQQASLVVGTIASAAVIPLVLTALDKGKGIAREGREGSLDAPQATLMKELSTGIFGAGINWWYILIGCGLAVLIIAFDQYLKRRKAKFRTPILAVAVGIYLPFGLSVLIFVGGMLSLLASRIFKARNEHERIGLENAGLLLASGLITGESLMAVALAVILVIYPALADAKPVAGAGTYTLLATAVMIIYLLMRTLRAARATRNG